MRIRLACLTLLLGALAAFGCRVDKDDLRRWEKTQNGPEKLISVLTHDKYERELRVEAAWSLIEMKKRGGQSVGLTRLIEELNKMSPGDRKEILAGLWQKLQPKASQPLEPAGEGKYADPGLPYKDATFALYSDEKLDIEPKVRDEMTKTLTEWATGKDNEAAEKRLLAFEARMDNSAQAYGVEQILRKLGMAASQRLPALLTAASAIKSQRLDTIARVTIDVKPPAGDAGGNATYEKTREEISVHYAKLLKDTVGEGYIEAVRAETEDALKKNPNGQQVLGNPEAKKKYFDKVRDDRLSSLFAIVKQVGRKAVVAALLEIAGNEKAQKEHRALSLAALDGNVDTSTTDHMKAFLAIAKSNAPDEVKHNALNRITAYSPEQTVKAFYELFDSPNWKVRYDGAISVLNLMIKVGEKAKTTPKEFLSKLPAKDGAKMGLGEPSTYGQYLAQMPKELNAKAAIDEALRGTSMGAQLTALGWYLSVGKKDDYPTLAKYEADKSPVPKCKDDDDCGWDKPGCGIPKPGGKADEKEWKSVTNVGEYVQFCVKPAIEERAKAPPPPPPEAPK